MELSVKERFGIFNILPKESNFLTLKIVRKLEENLSFSEVEVKELGFVEKDGMINYNPVKEAEMKKKNIDIDEIAMDIIVDTLIQLERASKLPNDLFNFYEKFVIKNK